MPIALIRVDDRLLHGQVIVGWGRHLDLEWYVVVDDELAADEEEQRLYTAGVPEGVGVDFLDVIRAAEEFPALDDRPGAGCVLLGSTAPLARLARRGVLEGRRVVLGPLGASGDRRRVLDYLHLGPADVEDLRAAAEAGAEVVARDVPSSRPVPLAELDLA